MYVCVCVFFLFVFSPIWFYIDISFGVTLVYKYICMYEYFYSTAFCYALGIYFAFDFMLSPRCRVFQLISCDLRISVTCWFPVVYYISILSIHTHVLVYKCMYVRTVKVIILVFHLHGLKSVNVYMLWRNIKLVGKEGKLQLEYSAWKAKSPKSY